MVAIKLPQKQIAEFCRQNGIQRLAVFGSALRDDFTPESDVDVFVEFEPGKTPGFRFFGIQQDLSEMIGRNVDLNTEGFLSKYIRDKVLAEAVTIYDGS